MPKHVFPGRRPLPALRLHPLALTALIAVSALGSFNFVPPSAVAPPPGAAGNPIALWLDTGPRDPESERPTHPEAPLLASAVESSRPATDPSPAATAAEDRREAAVTAQGAAPQAARDFVAEATPPPAPAVETPLAERAPESPAPTAPAVAPPQTVQADPGPKISPAEEEQSGAVPSRWREREVRKGETLAQVLKAFGVEKSDRAKVLAAAKGTPALAKLKVGQKIRGQIDGDGALLELQLQLGAKTSLHVELEGDDYRIHTIDRPVEKLLTQTSAVIQSSLFIDGQDAGLSDAQILELAAIFGWEIDFALGLRAGDRFSLIYEAEYLDGQKIDNGAILAAEFVNQGRSYRAVRFEDDDGTLGYYAPDGTSKKQAFLRSPLKLGRVSSNFSLSRQHPILNTRRAHKGVDYSAPIGTPVKATGEGEVVFSGQKNGYGNVIELQHGEKYTTLYGHLSRFAEGMRVGTPVKQGQVIGYVGQTGLATGPHLHYEFRVAGQHRDPLSTKLPTAVPLDGQDFAIFRKKAAPLLAQLDRMERTMLARAY